MVEIATYTLPVYEAVVCGLTLTSLPEEKAQQGLLRASINLQEKMQTAVETFRKGDFSRISKSDVEPIARALATLVATIHGTAPALRDSLRTISEAYRPAQMDMIANIEKANERMEEIAEAWCMAIDESSISEIREAISAAMKTDDVKPWREVLASFED